MAWQGLEGHDDVVEQFRRALARAGGSPARSCSSARRGSASGHLPSGLPRPCCVLTSLLNRWPLRHLRFVRAGRLGRTSRLVPYRQAGRPPSIPIQLLVGDDAHRMREGLCHDLALKPFMGGRKVAIIDDADDLNEEGANCLLKTLEEPPPAFGVDLDRYDPDKQLPTIRSRCQVVRFRPLPADTLAEILVAAGFDCRCRGGGASGRRLRMAAWNGRSGWPTSNCCPFARSCFACWPPCLWIASRWRDDLRRPSGCGGQGGRAAGAGTTVHCFRRGLLSPMAAGPTGIADERGGTTGAGRRANLSPHVDEPLTAIHFIESVVGALAHVDRNAHQATNLECWCDDLARIVESGQPAAFATDN